MKRKSGGQQQQNRPDKRRQSRGAAAVDQDELSERPTIQDGGTFTQVELAGGQAVALTGSATLEVTAGCLEVYGALVTPDSGPVCLQAPSWLGKGLLLTATAAPAATTVPPTLPAPASARAVLQPLPAAAAAAAAAGSAEAAPAPFRVVHAATPDAPVTWQVPAPWQHAASDLAAAAAAASAPGSSSSSSGPLVVAVCGSKGAGKSAFARLLVNMLLSSSSSSSSTGAAAAVAFLDLDPGQPEFTPPGLLSLHLLRQPVFGGSAALQPQQQQSGGHHHHHHHQPQQQQQQQQELLLQCFQGDTSSQSEPGRYLQAVQALCSCYASLATHTAAAAAGASAAGGGNDGSSGSSGLPLPPLVINTPGWITGLGLELLGEALRCVQPTHVVQLQTSNVKKNLPAGCWWLDDAGQTAAAAAAAGAAMPLLLQVPSVGGGGADAPSTAGDGGGRCAALNSGPAASTLSCQSGDTAVTGGGGGGLGGGRVSKGPLSAAASRGIMWLAWAQRVAAACHPAANNSSSSSSGSSDEFSAAAAALAAAHPYETRLSGMAVEVLHAQVAPSELPVALNGAIVGLASSSSSSSSSGQLQGLPLRPCIGLGLVRAVDAPNDTLYLLTDVPPAQLSCVDTLLLGKLELPERLLEGRAASSPYQGLFCLTSTATGAGQIRSRNNLLRASQLHPGAG